MAELNFKIKNSKEYPLLLFNKVGELSQKNNYDLSRVGFSRRQDNPGAEEFFNIKEYINGTVPHYASNSWNLSGIYSKNVHVYRSTIDFLCINGLFFRTYYSRISLAASIKEGQTYILINEDEWKVYPSAWIGYLKKGMKAAGLDIKTNLIYKPNSWFEDAYLKIINPTMDDFQKPNKDILSKGFLEEYRKELKVNINAASVRPAVIEEAKPVFSGNPPIDQLQQQSLSGNYNIIQDVNVSELDYGVHLSSGTISISEETVRGLRNTLSTMRTPYDPTITVESWLQFADEINQNSTPVVAPVLSGDPDLDEEYRRVLIENGVIDDDSEEEVNEEEDEEEEEEINGQISTYDINVELSEEEQLELEHQRILRGE